MPARWSTGPATDVVETGRAGQNGAMSWLLLAFGAWCAACVVNAFHPIRRNKVLFVWSFMAAWLTIEGTLAWLVIELGIGALLIWAGALDRVAGWIGLAFLVLAWVGQVVLLVQGRATAATAAAAIGDFGRDAIGARPADPRSKVAVDRNIEFRKVAGRRLKLDVYRPATPPEPGARRPAILQIHGGGWVIGDKREQGIPLLRYLAARGWVGLQRQLPAQPGGDVPRPPRRRQGRRWRGSGPTPTSTASTPTSWSSPAVRPAGTSPR